MKFAATILALALATTHGLLDEGDHNVQKKDASKGLRGSAVDSSLERAAVGRKLDFYYGCPPFTTFGPDRTVCGVCSKSGKECNLDQPNDVVCDEGDGGTCSLDTSRLGYGDCEKKCRCCDGTEPDLMGNCVNYRLVCTGDNATPCNDSQDCSAEGGPGGLCQQVQEGDCAEKVICCDGTIGTIAQCRTIRCDPTPVPTTRPPTPEPTPCPKRLDVCIAVDESGSICSPPGNPQLCIPSEIPPPGQCSQEDGDQKTCVGPSTASCAFGEGCPKFNDVPMRRGNVKRFVTDFINELNITFMGVNDALRVGVVEFATKAEETTPLTTPELAITQLKQIEYSGGYTNVQQAIKACRDALSSSSDNSEVILIVSDGDATAVGEDGATTCDSNSPGPTICKGLASTEATNAKDIDKITIATAFVLDTGGDGSDFLEAIASKDTLYVPDVEFPEPKDLADAILEEVELCSSN